MEPLLVLGLLEWLVRDAGVVGMECWNSQCGMLEGLIWDARVSDLGCWSVCFGMLAVGAQLGGKVCAALALQCPPLPSVPQHAEIFCLMGISLCPARSDKNK